MRKRDEDPEPAGGAVPWTRRALVSLWLVAFALASAALAVRWDGLMAGLAGAPFAQARGAQR